MLAIIPARGGSKGLPGKNIRPLLGKPLIAYAVECALASKHISQVIISTDDPEIAEVAVKYGAENPFMRPPELASDTAMALDNYIYTVDRLNKDRSEKIKNIIILQPTTPLRTVEDLDGAMDLFFKKDADSVVTYCEEHHPITWHKYVNEDSSFTDIFDPNNLKNRQDHKPTYYPNGGAFVFNFERTLRQRQYYTEKSYAYIMPRNRSVDIDTLEDFEYAEFLLNRGGSR